MHIKDFDPYDFSKKEIDGVPVYYKNLPWAPCIHIRVVFKTGAFNDPVGKEGLAHFFEHLVFNGCPSLPNKKAIKEWEKINTLNTSNASTYFNRTVYFLKCLPEKYETVLAGMKDMIFHSYFKPEDVEHERKIITQEAWNRFLNQKKLNYIKEFLNNIYHGHIRSRFNTPLGWPETIAKVSREDIINWHKTHYGIGNFFIMLVGAVEEKHLNKLKDFIKDLPKAEPLKEDFGKIGKPIEKKFIKRADDIGEIKEQVEISISRSAEEITYEKNLLLVSVSSLLNDILYERLRLEHSLCYSVRVSSYNVKTLSGIWMNVKTEEKNIEKVEKEFLNVLQEIKDGKHKNRFDILKGIYIDTIKSLELSSGTIADNTLEEISIYNGRIITMKEELDLIEKIEYNDVAKFIDWAYDLEHTFTEIILPSKK